MVVAGMALTLAAPVAHAAEPLPSDLTLVVRGGGWGHGHGMSQYGAGGMADQGFTWRQILSHYYTGVDIDDRGNPKIRVLISNDDRVVIGGPEAYTVRWGAGDLIRTRSDEHPFTRIVAKPEGIVVAKGESKGGPWTRVAEGDKTKVIVTPDDGPAVPVWQHGRHEYFRGEVHAVRRTDSIMYGINELRLDEYLYGVVPREMPAGWHGQALRAQAVAARSYSLWKRASAGGSARYHICATTQCQVYRGYGVRERGEGLQVLEHSRTTAAVDATSGQTMVTDAEGPIFAEYHSTSGGATGQGSRPYLAPVLDPYDDASPYHRWTETIEVADIEQRWDELGRLVRIGTVQRNGIGPWGGRVEQITFVGTQDNVTVTGPTFRAAMGLRASLFTIKLYDAEVDRDPSQVVVGPGGTGHVVVRMRNTGDSRWDPEDVRIATANPKGRTSAFESPSWLTSTRAAAVTEEIGDGDGTIEPGEVAEFRFELAAPAGLDGGLYDEDFRLHLRNTTWFGDIVTVPIRVGFAGAAHLGGNLLANPSFEAAEDGSPAGWTHLSGAVGDIVGVSVDGSTGLQMDGVDGRTRYRQVIDAAGRRGDRYVVSGWNRAEGTKASRGDIDVTLAFIRTSGDRINRRITFPSAPHGWTFDEAGFTSPRRYKRLEVTLSIRKQTGTTWFDRVRLVRSGVVNGGFEDGGGAPSDWSYNRPGKVRSAGGQMAQGTASLRLNALARGAVRAKQVVRDGGSAGDSLRLSAWNRSGGTRADGGAIWAQVRLRHSDGTKSLHRVQFPRTPHDWVYGETIFVAPKDFDRAEVWLRVAKQRGAAWFDEVALTPLAEPDPLADNPGFELGSPEVASWELFQVAADDAGLTDQTPNGKAALYIDGAAGKNRHAEQRVPLGGRAGDRFRLSGWSRTVGSDPDGGPVRIWARVHHADGSVSKHVINFDRGPHGWTDDQLTFSIPKEYVAIDVEAKFSNQSGQGFFDGIVLQRLR